MSFRIIAANVLSGLTRRQGKKRASRLDAPAQAAVIGIAVAELVIGGWTPGDERTPQYEGLVDRPRGTELERLKGICYKVFPGGPQRLSWPGLVYLRTRPLWMRCSDFNGDPAEIMELNADQIAALN